MGEIEVVTWSLAMHDPAALRPRRSDRPGLRVREAELPSPAFSRFLYVEAGRDWHWTDRLTWSSERWRTWLDRPALTTHVLYERGTPAGYYELERQGDGLVEIAIFGLLPASTGRGLGGHLLTDAVERAWAQAGT